MCNLLVFFGCQNLDNTYGMAYSPMTYQSSGTNGSGYYVAGNTSWTKTSGRKTGTYKSGYGGTGLYYLGARLDDELHGYAEASGIWNSDSW